MKNPLAQLKTLPKNQRIALGVGGAGALGAGLYSFRKKKLAGSPSPASTTSPGAGGLQSTLTPAPDLSQYGQVAVLVPIDWQDGANFGGTAGLTGPLNPSNPTNNPTPIAPTPAPTTYGPLPANPVAGYQPDGSIAVYGTQGWQRVVPLGSSGIAGGTAYGTDPHAPPLTDAQQARAAGLDQSVWDAIQASVRPQRTGP